MLLGLLIYIIVPPSLYSFHVDLSHLWELQQEARSLELDHSVDHQ